MIDLWQGLASLGSMARRPRLRERVALRQQARREALQRGRGWLGWGVLIAQGVAFLSLLLLTFEVVRVAGPALSQGTRGPIDWLPISIYAGLFLAARVMKIIFDILRKA